VLTTQPEVYVQDVSGNTVTDSTIAVTASVITLNLYGTKTVNAVAGVATFTDLAVGGTASSTYNLTFSATNLTSANAASNTLTYGDAASITLSIPSTA
jgi:hypothetical protein